MATEQGQDATADLMEPVQVRRLLGISLRTYQRYVHDGTLTPAGYTLKGHRRFDRAHVEALRSSVADAKTTTPDADAQAVS